MMVNQWLNNHKLRNYRLQLMSCIVFFSQELVFFIFLIVFFFLLQQIHNKRPDTFVHI